MIRTPFQSFCLLMLLFVISACAAPGKIEQKVHFDGENSQVVALSPFYLPDPLEKRADHAWALTLKVSDGEPHFGLIKPNQLLAEPLFEHFTVLGLKPGQGSVAGSAEYMISGCQGQVTVQASIDAAGLITGSLQYQDFSDDCSLVFDASLPFSGRLDLGTGLLAIDLSYEQLPARMGSRNFLLTGRLQMGMSAFAGPQQTYSANVDLSLDEINGQQHRLEEMLLSWDLTGRYPRFSMTGEIYFDHYGEVAVATDSPLMGHRKNSPPFDGMLTFSGAEGSWRRLYFPKSIDPGAFRIDGSNGMKTMGKF